MEWIHQFSLAFMAFFAIMNPVSSLPVYLSLTDGDDAPTARLVASRALIIAFAIVLVFALCGRLIFEIFGITLPALRIAGGALVFLIGFHMLQGRTSDAQHPAEVDNANLHEARLSVAVSPLATPMLAGPGTIATAMNLSASSRDGDLMMTVAAFAVLCVITYVLFVYGKKVVRLLGKSVMDVITRMMGLILAVIGVQMMIVGLQGAFKVLN